MTNDEIIDRALVSGASRDAGGYGDVVYLAEISNKVARMNQSSGESLLRETRSLVQRILDEQLMLVGDASSTGFTP